MRRFPPAIAGLAIVLASCAPEPVTTSLDPSTATPAQVRAAMTALDTRLSTLHGRGNLTFESPEMSGSASFDVTLRRPDSLLVELEGPFGIQVGTFFLSRDRFVMYNSLQNTVQSGAPNSESLASIIPVKLTPDQVISTFAGTFPMPGSGPESSKLDDGYVLQQFRVPSGRQYFWIDRETLLVRKFRLDDETGAVVLEGETSGVIARDGARIPRRITVSLPRQERRMVIAFSSADLNTDRISFSYTVPSSARPVR